MTRKKRSLLEELEYLDAALLDGTATEKQEARGGKIVRLANAAPQLFAALEYFYNIMHDYENSLEKGYIEIALEMARDAIASAKEK